MATATPEARSYVTEKRGDQWCLLSHDRAKVLGCHDTEAGAQGQERAIQARQHATDVLTIPGVQIFKAGTWNGDTYGVDDLDAMITAASTVGFGIPLKNGHTDDRGAPALGWVENLRRVGNALYADLVALPKKVYDAIVGRSYDAVSAEIYWDLERNGQTFPRALKALALLGAEIPAVDLEPLRAFLSLNSMPPLPAWHFAAYATDLSTDLVLDRETMAMVCPSCAEAMKSKGIARLKIPRTAEGGYAFAAAFKTYQGFSEAMCEKFGESEGFRTRCMESMAAHVEDPGAFCNALKQHCGLDNEEYAQAPKTEVIAMAAATPSGRDAQADAMEPNADGECPEGSEKGPDGKCHKKEETMSQQDGTQVRDGEIVVKLSEITALREAASRARDLPNIQRELAQAAEERARLEAEQREERIKFRLLRIKVPAFRAYAKVFYDLAMLQAGSPKTYAVTDPRRPLTAEGVVDAWVDELNRQSETLFRTLSVDGGRTVLDPDEPDEAGARVEYRIKKYRVANPAVPYREALQVVLDADSELKEAYRAS